MKFVISQSASVRLPRFSVATFLARLVPATEPFLALLRAFLVRTIATWNAVGMGLDAFLKRITLGSFGHGNMRFISDASEPSAAWRRRIGLRTGPEAAIGWRICH